MKHILQKYSLETFSFIVLIILLIRFLFYPDLPAEHRILSAFMILAILHEFEEKRTPGGFFELMAKKFGLPAEQRLFEKAGLCVIIYLRVIFIVASLYSGMRRENGGAGHAGPGRDLYPGGHQEDPEQDPGKTSGTAGS